MSKRVFKTELDAVNNSLQSQVNNSISKNIVDAKGDIVTASAADTPIRLAVGTNEQRLVVDSATTSGLKYVADTTNYAINAKGDLLVGTAADTVTNLAVASTAGWILTVDSATTSGLKWAAAAGGSLTPYCSVHANGTNITDNVATEAVFSNESFDSDNAYNTSTGRFTPQTAGKYFVISHINLTANGTDIWHQGTISLRKNGTEFARCDADFYAQYATYTLPMTISSIVECNGTTDYISTFVTLNVTSGGTPQYGAASRMNIYKIGA